MEDGVYSLEQRKRAVELYIKYGLKATAAIRELGYPSRAQLVSWHREWQENGGRLTDRSLEQYTLGQKRAAVRHYLTHGRCNAFTRRELGYPKCTAKLAEWIDEYAPGERRATQPRVFDASEKAAAVKALVSRASSAQEVADEVMSAEANQLCEATGNSRNGYRERMLVTYVSALALRVPKLLSGTFFLEDVLECCQRVDWAVLANVAETCATGVSTRKVQRAAAAMGIERISKDQAGAC